MRPLPGRGAVAPVRLILAFPPSTLLCAASAGRLSVFAVGTGRPRGALLGLSLVGFCVRSCPDREESGLCVADLALVQALSSSRSAWSVPSNSSRVAGLDRRGLGGAESLRDECHIAASPGQAGFSQSTAGARPARPRRFSIGYVRLGLQASCAGCAAPANLCAFCRVRGRVASVAPARRPVAVPHDCTSPSRRFRECARAHSNTTTSVGITGTTSP